MTTPLCIAAGSEAYALEDNSGRGGRLARMAARCLEDRCGDWPRWTARWARIDDATSKAPDRPACLLADTEPFYVRRKQRLVVPRVAACSNSAT